MDILLDDQRREERGFSPQHLMFAARERRTKSGDCAIIMLAFESPTLPVQIFRRLARESLTKTDLLDIRFSPNLVPLYESQLRAPGSASPQRRSGCTATTQAAPRAAQSTSIPSPLSAHMSLISFNKWNGARFLFPCHRYQYRNAYAELQGTQSI
jgi:hypothetical protein